MGNCPDSLGTHALQEENADFANLGFERGSMRLAPGSLIWEPAKGVAAASIELAHAAVLPSAAPAKTRRKSTQPSQLVALETPIGRADLELSPKLFAAIQEMVAALAGARPADGP